ncbi:hypothetical protein JB92DRAFT_2960727 [Gautieria morchelliformis]|nr:hypothetical protein JB92DRAFT_2960727 [Gautieria morchelliformis]
MMMENEEKNSYQLGCARVLKVSDSLVSTLLQYGLESTPPSHQPCMTLTFALMWMLSSQDSLAHEDPTRRAAILDFLEPLMLRVNEPSNDFNDLVDKTQTPHRLVPSHYFGFSMHFNMPSITQLARLCSVERYNAAKNIPWTGVGGFEARSWSSSTRFDVDWLRMVSILGPPPSGATLTGNAYVVGNFEGMFEGDFFITHPIGDNSKFFTSSRPMQCSLREYHSISPDEYLRFDEGDDDHKEGGALARAWFPEDIELKERASTLVIHDRGQDRWLNYTAYPEFSEFTDTTRPPIYDTILVGETHPSYAIHGQYSFHGRVRARDGTVALIRTPVLPNLEDEGTWVFVGHLQAETDFVGDWSVASTREDIPGGHGWFSISKTQVFGPLGI